MVPNGKVEFVWADGDHVFNIAKFAEALELEEKCGPAREILNRLTDQRWGIKDIYEIIRLALIGGGLEPTKAALLCKRYVVERPWQESVIPAQIILAAAIVGLPGDEVGKKPTAEQTGEKESPSTAKTADSSAPQSTASEPVSDGRQDKPTSIPSGNSARRSKASTGPTAQSNR